MNATELESDPALCTMTGPRGPDRGPGPGGPVTQARHGPGHTGTVARSEASQATLQRRLRQDRLEGRRRVTYLETVTPAVLVA